MPVRRSCSFCGNEIEPGTGKMFIRKDGTVFLFCSHKCQANMLKLGRVPRWTPWTQAFRRAAGRVVAEEAVVVEAAPAEGEPVLAEVKIEAPKGKDIPSDFADLIDKRLGPDLSRSDVEKFYAEFVESGPFRTSILGWARKKHGAKPISTVERAEFLAWKDSPEGRRAFKAWLDGAWQTVKGRKRERVETAEAEEEAPAPTAKKAKKGK
jgi:large subunit ribosomal protein L24e